MDVSRFGAMVKDGQNFEVYSRKLFECDTVLRSWKRRWAVLSRQCVELLIHTRFAGMSFVCFKQEFAYCHRLRGVVDVCLEVLEG